MPDINTRQPMSSESVSNGNTSGDPLLEAEAIRSLLADTQARLARLVGVLKHFRKQSRAVQAAVQSLRQLPPLTP